MSTKQVAAPAFPFPVSISENTADQFATPGAVLASETSPPNVDTSLTGVSATAQAGTPAASINASVTLTGVAATSATGSLTAGPDGVFVGVAAITAVGTFSLRIDSNLTLTGAAATSAAGTLVIEFDATGVLTAVPVVTAVSFLTVGFSGGVDIIGVETDSAIGDLALATSGSSLDGVASDSALGDLSLEVDTNPAIHGVSSTIAENPSLAFGFSIDGVEATSEVGDAEATNMQLPSSLLAVGLGSLAVQADNGVIVGVPARGLVGQLLAVSGANQTIVSFNGVSVTPQVGTLSFEKDAVPTGVEAGVGVSAPTVAVHTGGLLLTDILCEAIIQTPNDIDVTLRWSDTDGQSWQDSVNRSIGAPGATLTSPQWRRLGMSRRGRVFQLSWSCPRPTALQGATVMYEDAST